VQGTVVNMYSAVCLLRGRTYDALENRTRAIEWYSYASDSFKVLIRVDSLCACVPVCVNKRKFVAVTVITYFITINTCRMLWQRHAVC
jgi:hypothetical protein